MLDEHVLAHQAKASMFWTFEDIGKTSHSRHIIAWECRTRVPIAHLSVDVQKLDPIVESYEFLQFDLALLLQPDSLGDEIVEKWKTKCSADHWPSETRSLSFFFV